MAGWPRLARSERGGRVPAPRPLRTLFVQERQELVLIEPLCWADVQAGRALCARCARLVNRRLELMEWGRSLHRKINETWVHPHIITPVFTKIRASFKHPAPSRSSAGQSRRPASPTLPRDRANVPGLSSRWACGGAAAIRPSAQVGSGQEVRVQ